MISLKHISTLSVFNQTKFSADSTDSSYFLGSDQTQIFQGTPDVKYNDLCYIKCSNLQYTHGHLYGSTEVGEAHVSLTQEEYDALSEEEKNNGKIYLIKESTIPDLVDQLPLATTTTNGLMSAGDKTFFNNKGHVLIAYPSGSFYIDIWKSGNMILVRGNQDTTKQIQINNVQTKYEGLLPFVEFYTSYDNPVRYDKDNKGNIVYYSKKQWSTIVLIADNFAPLPNKISSSDIVFLDN
jgi:hypothetical protein